MWGSEAVTIKKCTKDENLDFRLFHRCDRSPSVQSSGPPFSIVLLRAAFRSVGLRAYTSVCGTAQCSLYVDSQATCVHSGLLHRQHAEPSPSFCA
ncbi:hypothetical protein EVAR_12138_1 [Eumeta japonica]|uniref:Uncharacterized protein n=1 Tax=Eumeta variegata TaxID=151549 RepID=A0A4C1UGU6_EUMVA|nr:hypothetical protein EVAR_12138_1 [Eumeta japonica]